MAMFLITCKNNRLNIYTHFREIDLKLLKHSAKKLGKQIHSTVTIRVTTKIIIYCC